MKKLALLLVIPFLFVGCNKENEPEITQLDVSGKWFLTEIYSIKTDEWTDVSVFKYYAEFNSDGSYSAYFRGSSYSGTWKMEDKKVIADVGEFFIYFDIIELNGDKGIFEMKYQEELGGIKLKAERK